MSTAEQIIAEHRLTGDPREEAMRCSALDCDWSANDAVLGMDAVVQLHAAHVVAALTNAGHLLLDPDDVQRLRLVIGFTDSSDVTRVPMQALLQRLDELDVAAARVAEGGA